MIRILGLGLLLISLLGCQTTTLVGASTQINPDLPSSMMDKADLNFKVAQELGSPLVGLGHHTYRIFAVVEYNGTFEEAQARLQDLDYVSEVKRFSSSDKLDPINEIVVAFTHRPLPNGELLGKEIIESHAYYGDDGGFIVLKIDDPLEPDFIDQLEEIPGVKFFEPNYSYAIPENE